MPVVRFHTKEKSFTLIELLVVVGLIAIISGVLLTVLNIKGIRGKTLDGRRISDLSKIQVALELYFADYTAYPASTPVYGDWINLAGTSSLETALVSGGYINNFPHDPEETGDNASPCSTLPSNRYNYRTTPTGSIYVLTAIMDVATSNDGHECGSLRNWSTLGSCGTTYPTSDYCYGVESP